MSFRVPEQYRIKEGSLASDESIGNNGAFKIPIKGMTFLVIVSDQLGWEHVSVSIPGRQRTPTWEQMCEIKDLFWKCTATVLQYHPSVEDYINHHPYCLHLWRPTIDEISKPPSWMIGPKK